MQTFLVIWAGQLVSAIGSQMTLFALTVWIWQKTGSATSLALIGLSALLSSILSTPLVGQLVDRYPRKRLMLVGDTAIALAVSLVLLLNLADILQVWHLYAIALFIGLFDQLQKLAYQASLSSIVSERHYARASSMGMMIFYGSQILSPALAGVLYPKIGLTGIIAIDLVTFAIALFALVGVRFPDPATAPLPTTLTFDRSLTFGIRYILARPRLMSLAIATTAFWFFHELADTLVSPMILARTNGDTTSLGRIFSAAGLGGAIGAIALAVWGGPKCRARGLALGMIGVGASRIFFGLGRSLPLWLPTQFCASLQFPLFGSSEQALWLSKIESHLQGRIFAVQMLAQQIAIALAMSIAGPLADTVFEPAMQSGGLLASLLGQIWGIGSGAGMGMLVTLCAGGMILTGVGAYLARFDEL